MGTGFLLLLIAFVAGGGGGKRVTNGKQNGTVWDDEPDEQPGPIIRGEEAEPDVDDADIRDQEPPPDDDEAWFNYLDTLISDEPTPGKFYLVKQGDTMAAIAGAALGSANTGSNRVAYIKCATRVPWNDALYVSDRHPGSWGTLFDVDGRNLSAAFLPRNAKATQSMVNKQLPPRNIDGSGNYTSGQTGYFGLLWLPPVTATQAYGVQCSPSQPPAQLMNQLS